MNNNLDICFKEFMTDVAQHSYICINLIDTFENILSDHSDITYFIDGTEFDGKTGMHALRFSMHYLEFSHENSFNCKLKVKDLSAICLCDIEYARKEDCFCSGEKTKISFKDALLFIIEQLKNEQIYKTYLERRDKCNKFNESLEYHRKEILNGK